MPVSNSAKSLNSSCRDIGSVALPKGRTKDGAGAVSNKGFSRELQEAEKLSKQPGNNIIPFPGPLGDGKPGPPLYLTELSRLFLFLKQQILGKNQVAPHNPVPGDSSPSPWDSSHPTPISAVPKARQVRKSPGIDSPRLILPGTRA